MGYKNLIRFMPDQIRLTKWHHLRPLGQSADILHIAEMSIQACRFRIAPANAARGTVFGLCFALPTGEGSERSHNGFRDHSYCEQYPTGGLYLFRRDSDLAGLRRSDG